MNKIIKEQLKRITKAKVEFDDSTTHILIKKDVKISPEIGKSYLIHLHNSITHPNETSVLACNWNHNIVPKSDYYVCTIIQKMGNMIKINGQSFNNISYSFNEDVFNGWLPLNEIDILERK